MTTWWCKCTVCGRNFPTVNRNATVCPDVKRHDEINAERRTRKDDKKDGGNK